jgi:hypothetical protein
VPRRERLGHHARQRHGVTPEIWTTASKRIGWVYADAVPSGTRGIAARSLTTLAMGAPRARGVKKAAKTAKRRRA